MTEAPELVPVLPLLRQIEALAHLGLDVAALRSRLGELPQDPGALVPAHKYAQMWQDASSMYVLPGLPTALGMAIPFGAFGALDYLAGSSGTVAAACESVVLHMAMVAVDVAVAIEPMGDGAYALEVRGIGTMPAQAVEFTLASVAGRLRYLTRQAFQPRWVGLPCERPAQDPVRARLWGVPLRYAQPGASLCIDAATWALAIHGADPYLHATLQGVAAHLHLAPGPIDTLELALRARLRDALAQGQASAQRLARLLGVSERTLQRRLQDVGRSFSDVVEDFRQEEAVRLMQDSRLPLVHIADRLGYAEQSSFTRAFRRWTGETPAAWRAARKA
ncbi:MAG: helix-turn-helix domain-containing protein [Caldimonas sp.]